MMEIKIAPLNKPNMYLTETFGDEVSGGIHRLTPVLPDGSPDPIRTVLYKAVTGLTFPGGNVLNVNVVIPGVKSLEEAIDAFLPTVEAVVRKSIQDAQDQMRRQSLLAGANGDPRLPGRTNPNRRQ